MTTPVATSEIDLIEAHLSFAAQLEAADPDVARLVRDFAENLGGFYAWHSLELAALLPSPDEVPAFYPLAFKAAEASPEFQAFHKRRERVFHAAAWFDDRLVAYCRGELPRARVSEALQAFIQAYEAAVDDEHEPETAS